MSKLGIEDLSVLHETKSEPLGPIVSRDRVAIASAILWQCVDPIGRLAIHCDHEKVEQGPARILLDETVVSMIPFEDFEVLYTIHKQAR